MNECVLYYDGFREFKVALAVNQFREKALKLFQGENVQTKQ